MYGTPYGCRVCTTAAAYIKVSLSVILASLLWPRTSRSCNDGQVLRWHATASNTHDSRLHEHAQAFVEAAIVAKRARRQLRERSLDACDRAT